MSGPTEGAAGPHRGDPSSDQDTLVWYVAYGSNLLWSRFRCYLAGGRPDGARRVYVGARDRAEPVSVLPVQIPGRVRFAGESSVWGGGMAFVWPAATARSRRRAYLITLEQLNDVVAQEIHRPTGTDLGLSTVVAGGELTLANARYDTVAHVGTLEARPMLTLTTRSAELLPASPAPAYLWSIAAGLREAHGWAPPRVAAYLAAMDGVAGQWTIREIETLAELDAAPGRSCVESSARG